MRKILQLAAGLAFGLVLGTTVSRALASRDASGTYTLPYPAFIPNAVISSSVMNGTFNDFKAELTDSLDRSGKGGMLAPVRGIDGTVAAPAHSYTSETGSGDYRKAAGNVCRAILGADVACFSATGVVVTGSVTATSLVGPLTGNVTGNVIGNVTGTISSPAGSVFAGSATNGAVKLTPLATPSAPANGEMWVDTSTNTFDVQVNGATQKMFTSVTKSSLPAVGQQVSASSGNFLNTGNVEVDVTNLSVTLTTVGRPVLLVMEPDGSTNNASLNSSGAATPILFLDRGGANIAQWVAMAGSNSLQGMPLLYLDPVAAGTYTWKVRVNPNNAGNTAGVFYFKLVAWEL